MIIDAALLVFVWGLGVTVIVGTILMVVFWVKYCILHDYGE